MKHLLPVNRMKEDIAQVFKEKPMRSGCYNWTGVFDGVIASYNDVKEWWIPCDFAVADSFVHYYDFCSC